ncbi:YphA family membrane protein [Bacillus testis]|uniref:YphA family membrane protein n=1 Tax=Bacillus testis TaxID=1622072 RepID=UPI00067F2C50|nr:hypothetical protein [Bacillus testis]
MEGLIFVWSCWLLLILFVFFFHTKVPSSFSIHLLCLLFLSQFTLGDDRLTVNAAALYVVLVLCFYMSVLRFKAMNMQIMASITIALCLGSYELFRMMEPITFLWMPDWSIAVPMVLISIIMLKDSKQRMLALMMGMIVHEVLFLLLYGRFGIIYPVFSLSWLDRAASVTLCYLVFALCQLSAFRLMNSSKLIQHKKEV